MKRGFDKNQLTQIEDLRSALMNVGDNLTLLQLVGLMTVALEPGLSINELAEKIGVPQQTASRYASLLMGRYQSSIASGLVEPLISQEISVEDPRKRALFLTVKGRAILERMILAATAHNTRREG